MSRARPFDDPMTGERHWFNQTARATAAQLELLADWEGIELDDLLDEGLSQKQVLFRLREAATPGVIPQYVLERRRERERTHGVAPACRICSLNGWQCEGRITRHHFVPRWLMLELGNYQAYAARSLCTIPICVSRHRDLHIRDARDKDKSILRYLRPTERRFAEKMLGELKAERPKIYELLLGGDYYAYEWQLVRDHSQGRFRNDDGAYGLDEYQFDTNAVGRIAS